MSAKPRFQILDIGVPPGQPTVILSDFAYWAQHQMDLDRWLGQHGGIRTGSLITDLTPANLTLFAVRWS
jgi:hypothetical protein